MYIYIILYFIWWSKLIPNHYGGLRIKRIADYERTLRSVSDSRVKVKASVRLNTGSFEKCMEAAWNAPATENSFPRMRLFLWLCILKLAKTGSFEKCMEAAWNAPATENYFPWMSLFLLLSGCSKNRLIREMHERACHGKILFLEGACFRDFASSK